MPPSLALLPSASPFPPAITTGFDALVGAHRRITPLCRCRQEHSETEEECEMCCKNTQRFFLDSFCYLTERVGSAPGGLSTFAMTRLSRATQTSDPTDALHNAHNSNKSRLWLGLQSNVKIGTENNLVATSFKTYSTKNVLTCVRCNIFFVTKRSLLITQ
jgi:hypothetical protein